MSPVSRVGLEYQTPVLRNIIQFIDPDSPECISTVKEMRDHLILNYRDSDRKRKAQNEWDALRMISPKIYNNDKVSFQAFKNAFCRLAAETRLPKNAWKDEFERRLSPTLQKVLATPFLDDQCDFKKIVTLAQKIDFTNVQADLEARNRRDAQRTVAGWRMSKVFHADRLRRFADNPLPGQDYERPDGEILDGEEEWGVDRVLSSRLWHGRLQYQVQWRGWDPDPTFYDADNFKNACARLEEFHEANPDCEGPPARLSAWKQAYQEDKTDPRIIMITNQREQLRRGL